MPESQKHIELVLRIVSHIKKTRAGIDQVLTLHDLPSTERGNKPPNIGGFRPDVFAMDAPQTQTILGEAKTFADLETQHTRRQLQAFFSFLRTQPSPTFILGVPWQARARAQSVLGTIANEMGANDVLITVLDEVVS